MYCLKICVFKEYLTSGLRYKKKTVEEIVGLRMKHFYYHMKINYVLYFQVKYLFGSGEFFSSNRYFFTTLAKKSVITEREMSLFRQFLKMSKFVLLFGKQWKSWRGFSESNVFEDILRGLWVVAVWTGGVFLHFQGDCKRGKVIVIYVCIHGRHKVDGIPRAGQS